MSKTKICPVCGYDPSRDAARYPALARVRANSALFTAHGWEEFDRRLSRIEELLARLCAAQGLTSFCKGKRKAAGGGGLPAAEGNSSPDRSRPARSGGVGRVDADRRRSPPVLHETGPGAGRCAFCPP